MRDVIKPCFSRHVGNFEIQNFVISGEITEIDLSHAILVLETANDPCGPARAMEMVTALRLRTTTRPEHVNDISAMVSLYAEDLAEYPEDVALAACKSLANSSKWFPAWSEIFEACEWRVKRRRLMLDALKAHEERLNGKA